MRIILPVHTFFPDSGGGTEIYTLSLARHLINHGHEILILTCDSPLEENTTQIVERSDQWQGLPITRLGYNLLNTPNPVQYDYYNPLIEAHLVKIYQEYRADLVHVCHPGCLSTAVVTAAKKLRIPVVLTATDFWTICPTSQLLRHDRTLCQGPDDLAHCLLCTVHQRKMAQRYQSILDKIPIPILRQGIEIANKQWFGNFRYAQWVKALSERQAWMLHVLGMVDRIISPSRFLRDRLVDNGAPADSIMVSAHGIETDWLTSESRTKNPSHQLRFAYIGAIAWHKGVHIAIDAFNRLSKNAAASLVIFGDNQQDLEYFDTLKPEIERNPQITFGGRFTRDQLAQVLSTVDVLIVPSLWYENTPTIMYEAFATGTPVIASRSGGMAELIADFNGGWTYPLGNTDSLAQLMDNAIQNPPLVARVLAGIRPVRAFREHASDVLEIYRQLT